MSLSTRFFRKLLVSTAALMMAASAFAQQPTAAQIEQFQRLPKAQQEALAKQYGVDLSSITGGSSANRLQSNSVDKLQPAANSNDMLLMQALADLEDKRKTPLSDEPAKLRRFGENLFDAQISTFAPVSNAPVPDNYRLGPDDTLLLQLYGKQSDNYELVVNREGSVNLPDLGPVNVVGLTFTEASSLIRNRISEANIGLQAAVTMGKLRTINVFVAGEAANPGMYAVSALTSVTQALFVSGGVSDIGSLRDIRVTRNGKVTARFDLYDLLLKGNNANDITLQHGDVVFVAPAGAVVAIEGEVRRPAYYELAQGETLGQLLTMAGGLQASAHVNAVSLQRSGPNGRELVNLNLNETSAQNFALRSGDKLVVPLLSQRVRDQVTIVGAVSRPGSYAWKTGMQLHHLLGNVWSDLLNSTDTDYALVVRRINNRGDVEVMQFNLLDAVDTSQSVDFSPLTLQPQDIVLVFHEVNQAFEREKLNSFIRKAVQTKLTHFTENALLSGDITATFFKQIESSSALIASTQYRFEDNALTEPALIESFVANMLQQLYVNPEYLALSKHFTRRELLYPLLQTLSKQSTDRRVIPIVSVSGDVKVPGEYPLPVNGNVAMLIEAAAGLNSSAYLPRAELSRFLAQQVERNGVEQQNINIDLGAILSGEQQDVTLASRDRVNVFTTPDWSQVRLVNIRGEVRFPGAYQVLKGEKLSDVIKRAGGFTSDAYPYGAVFTREAIKNREAEQAAKLLEQLKSDVASRALTSQNTLQVATGGSPLALLNELQTLEPVGRMVVDLEQIALGKADYDIEVEHQDSLFIPRNQTSVTIMGEVQHPGSHRFRTGLNVNDYLALAGGARKRADDKRVFVIRADGSVMIPNQSRWFSASSDELKPGDTIIMPLDTEYKDGLSMWAQVTQIFYQTAVAIAALNSF
ncbi:SLBB domain-containing protein [Alishewanella tabrizica]|uniref:Sugar transporter n=1 Tax=Alishewanella tabrizica TaxID=671278 RepID=A0ABQ2WL23_9ALTE|nr:SLBB domain-containing protein [Alishewanella tabrizica]GGW58780.1 sugar transporter [Alishewanella tabrizica]